MTAAVSFYTYQDILLLCRDCVFPHAVVDGHRWPLLCLQPHDSLAGVWRIGGLESFLCRCAEGYHDGYDGRCPEEGAETLREGYLPCLDRLLVVDDGKHAAVEIIAQCDTLTLLVLGEEELPVAEQMHRDIILREEGAEYRLFLKSRLALPVALKELFYVSVVHHLFLSSVYIVDKWEGQKVTAQPDFF